MMVQPFKRGLNRKKKLWCQIEKKIKNGTVESKRGMSNRKTEKKAADIKKGCQAAKTKKRLWPTHQYKSRSRFWVVFSVLVVAVRAVGRRCRARPSFTSWVVAAGCCVQRVTRGWFRGWLQGSWLVPRSRCVEASRVAAAFWKVGGVMVFIKFPGRVGSGQPNSYRGQKKKIPPFSASPPHPPWRRHL